MKDHNGREIRIGNRVVHSEAKYVEKWPARKHDFPTMKNNRPFMSVPFGGAIRVKKFVGTTCIELDPQAGGIPVFLAQFLEVQD